MDIKGAFWVTIAKLHQLLRLPVLQGLAVLSLTLSQAYK